MRMINGSFKVVRTFSKKEGNSNILKDIAELLSKGNKIAVVLNKKILLSYVNTMVSPDGDCNIEELIKGLDVKGIKLNSGYALSDNLSKVLSVANEPIIFDEFELNDKDSFLVVKPFAEEPLKGFVGCMEFYGFDDDVIEIMEVKEV